MYSEESIMAEADICFVEGYTQPLNSILGNSSNRQRTEKMSNFKRENLIQRIVYQVYWRTESKKRDPEDYQPQRWKNKRKRLECLKLPSLGDRLQSLRRLRADWLLLMSKLKVGMMSWFRECCKDYNLESTVTVDMNRL